MDTLEHDARPSRMRLPRRRWTRAALAFAVLAALAAPAAWASHQFGDVPNSNPHHNDISAIFGARITTGCAPGLYCPGDAVTRQQMASFLRRGFGRTAEGLAIGEPVLATDGSWTDLAELTLTTGGASGGAGFVKLDGAATAYITSTTGCPCAARFRIVDELDSFDQWFYAQIDTIPSGSLFGLDSAPVSEIAEAATGTTKTFTLQGQRAAGTGTVNAYGQLTAIYAPFGSTGADVLEVQSSSSGPVGAP